MKISSEGNIQKVRELSNIINYDLFKEAESGLKKAEGKFKNAVERYKTFYFEQSDKVKKASREVHLQLNTLKKDKENLMNQYADIVLSKNSNEVKKMEDKLLRLDSEIGRLNNKLEALNKQDVKHDKKLLQQIEECYLECKKEYDEHVSIIVELRGILDKCDSDIRQFRQLRSSRIMNIVEDDMNKFKEHYLPREGK